MEINIYAIINNITKEIYVGQTKDSIQERFNEHIREARAAMLGKRQSFPLFHRMLLVYGAENFTVSLLEKCDEKVASLHEAEWITKLDTYHSGYNSQLNKNSNYARKSSLEPNKINQFTTEGEFIQNLEMRKILQYDDDSNVVASFKSVAEAAKSISVSAHCIYRALKNAKYTSGGFRWQYSDDPIPPKKYSD